MALRELMTDPPPRHPPRHMDAWLADHISLPPALERLLADLEAPSPSIQEFEVDLGGDEFGGLFKNIFASEGFFKVSGKVDLRRDEFGEAFKYSSHEAEKDARARVRLRVLRAIGNCPSLRTIILKLSGRIAVYSVTEAGAFLQALQQSNHVLERLDVSCCVGFGSAPACVALACLLRTSRSLTKLSLTNVGLTSEGLRHIAAALRAPHASSLQELDVSWNLFGGGGPDGGAPHLADIITRTSTLRSLGMYGIGLDMAGGEMIAHALATNPSLEELTVGWWPGRWPGPRYANESIPLTSILRALTLAVTQWGGSWEAPGTTRPSKLLSTRPTSKLSTYKCSALAMGLQSLEFWIDLPAKAKRQIFQALKDNPSIKLLVIDNWENLNDDLFEVLMTSLQVNTILETISMKGTQWDREGKITIVDELLKRKKRQVAYLDRLHHGNMKFNHPKVGRLFLCGSAFAGKTTLRRSLIRYEFNLQSLLYKLWFHVKPRRTQGVEIEKLMDYETMHVTIWDLAGQDEYRALQSFLFPSISQACIFFFVFSRYDEPTGTLKVLDDLANELDHWLRFISSNTLPGNDVVPQVLVILTHLDKMPLDGTSLDSMAPVRKIMVDLFAELFEKLKLVPEACTRMIAVLAKWRSRNSKWPIMRMPKFTDLCFESVEALRKSNKQDEQAVSILQAIASYLHDVGVIMFFQKLEIVVVDPNWISCVFLGKLMRSQDTGARGHNVLPSSSDGFVPEVALQTALRCFLDKKKHKGFDEKDMINLMLELKLCYQEQDPGALGVTRYFVPNTLIDVTGKALHGLRQLEWPLGVDGSSLRHIGRRLQCKDKLRTYLDPGFFPRLQVILQNDLFARRPEMRPEQYRNELNLIAFNTDGVEVFIEMPGDVGDLIDILVRSRKSAEDTRTFVVTHVLNEIRSFCASLEGSQGVELVEGIIRLDCVTHLTPCIYRRDQAVLKSELMEHLLREQVSNEACGQIFTSLEHLEYHHTWNKADGAGLPAHAERADALLDPEDLIEVLRKKERNVQDQLTMVEDAAKQVLRQAHGGDDSEKTEVRVLEDRLDTSFGHTMSDLGSTHRTLPNFHRLHLDNQQIKHALGKMDEKLDVIVSLQQQMVEKLQALQEQTLATVSSKMDEILNFSADLVKSEVPRRPYFTTDDIGTSQKLVAGIQLCKAVTLHFMCENPQGNHMVAGQVGLPLTVEIARWNWIRPIAQQSAKMLVFLVKAGLHSVAGIGKAVSDFAEWAGAAPLSAAAEVAAKLLDNINLQSSLVEHDKCVEEAWTERRAEAAVGGRPDGEVV